ncbi:MAG: hypothetical protein IIZ00_03135, partial [Oscillospiraceae bacterium]|nr:hypothetical protein [Oscillospiraceae bacterium]
PLEHTLDTTIRAITHGLSPSELNYNRYRKDMQGEKRRFLLILHIFRQKSSFVFVYAAWKTQARSLPASPSLSVPDGD